MRDDRSSIVGASCYEGISAEGHKEYETKDRWPLAGVQADIARTTARTVLFSLFHYWSYHYVTIIGVNGVRYKHEHSHAV